MLASVVMGQYCRVHQLLFIRSLQNGSPSAQRRSRALLGTRCRWWKPLSPVSGDGTERHAQAIPALYAASSVAVTTGYDPLHSIYVCRWLK